MAKNERIIKARVSANKIINCNRVFLLLQFLFIGVSLIFNFVLDDSAVIIVLFFHTALFIFYNIYTGHKAQKYFDAVDKYHSVFEIHRSRHLKRTLKLYKLAKDNNDNVMVELITQKAIKLFGFFIHLATTLMLVPVQ